MKISMIVAAADNNAIGVNGTMPWHMPRDLKFFKEKTTGHTVLMGSNTLRSLPKGALPNRRNMILSNRLEIDAVPNGEVFRSPEEAIEAARVSGETELYIIGGGRLYSTLLPFVDTIYLTRIHASFPDADTFFPDLPAEQWDLLEIERWPADEANSYVATLCKYSRRKTK